MNAYHFRFCSTSILRKWMHWTALLFTFGLVFGLIWIYIPAAAETVIFQDEFTGSMAEDWAWLNEVPSMWNLTENNGFLRIYASSGSSPSQNLLIRPTIEHDFVIETRLLFEPDTNFQFAGLVIYQDDSNFLQLGRAFCDVEGACVGNGIYFDQVLNGENTDGNFATVPGGDPGEAYLRLERQGERVLAFFSQEGITWVPIGTHWIPQDFVVNGVGLAASQDIGETGIYADFDYFMLSEGGGFLPEGYHDYSEGDVPAYSCNAGGWAVDPDDRDADLWVEINVDGASLPGWFLASEFRQDLEEAGLCVGGSCGFNAGLWELISSYEAHDIAVYAQDIPSGEWVLMSSTPKTITCRTYDIYAYDPLTGTTKQITDLRDSDEYDPTWSPNGKKVAHDVVSGDSHTINVTDVKTGESTVLHGTEDGGNDAAWSPNGKWIAFDRRWFGEPNIYIVPDTGGDRMLVRENAVSASWAPNGNRMVFQDDNDGSIRTIHVDGAKAGETLVVESGGLPAWSPDGSWITYSKDGDIWKIQVNIHGVVLGEPVQLTSGPFSDGKPTWSPDSQTIIYDSGFGQDSDLWSVPAEGGAPTWLTGAPVYGEYGPANARNSSNVAYAGFSPEGQAPRTWIAAFTYDLPSEYWSEGTHTYHFEAAGLDNSPTLAFDAWGDERLYDGTVLLRPWSLIARTGEECFTIEAINPNQPTKFHIGWTADGTYSEALTYYDNLMATVAWDSSAPVDLVRHEIFPFTSSVDWFGYNCTFTAGPPAMELRVNYGHDWVESFYEAGHQVVINVTESDGVTVKASVTVFTEPKDFWGGGTGFQTQETDWDPAPPDIQPYDWVYAQVDNGVNAQVQIGDISGVINLDADAIAGTINASWFDREVNVECFPWGAPEGVEMKFDAVSPDGFDTYSCSWSGEWDIDYYQDVGVGYFGQDGHWVANAFFVRNPHFTVFPEWEWFDGLEWPDGATVAISVEGKTECYVEKVSSGFFFNGNFGEGCNLEIGDTVTFTDGSTIRTHVVRNLAVTGVDVDENTIAGTADAATVVYVWPHDGWFEPLQATANEFGTWQVDLDDVGYDILTGASGRSEIRDEFGNATAVDWYVPRPRIVASITEDWFFMVEFTPLMTVDFSIYDQQDGSLLADGQGLTDSSGFVWINYDAHWVDLVPGNYLVVTDGTSTKELVVEEFTFDVFDLTQGFLQGTVPGAPEGRLVWVGIGLEGGDWSMDVYTDAVGSWVADFGTPVPVDYFWAAAQIFDGDGDASELRPALIIEP